MGRGLPKRRSLHRFGKPRPTRRPSSMITLVIVLSRVRAGFYSPTLVSSNAPKARSDACCASVRPRIPVIVSRS